MPKVMSAPCPVGKYFLRARIVGARLEAGIVDPLDAGVLLEMAGDGEGILRVAFEAQVEGFDALQEAGKH